MAKVSTIVVLMLTLSAAAWGQTGPAFNLLVDRDSIGVGEPLQLQLISDEPLQGGKHWQWPTLIPGDSLAQGWEILSVSELDSSASPVLDAGLRRQQNIAIMAWDTGMMVLAPIVLLDSGEVAAKTPLMEIEVGLVPLEANAAPKPMQGFKVYQFTWWERIKFVLPWIFGAVAIALLGRWLYRKWQSREPQEAEAGAPIVPKIPAHITALALLRQLEQDKPWTEGRGKEAQAVLSEAVRVHLQGSFGVKALERTTDELAQTLRSAPIRGMAADESDWMIALLQRSDLVKFAKQDMDGDAHLRVVQESIAWINRTIPTPSDDTFGGDSSDGSNSAQGHA
ncbi:MAG: hypothetical protein L7S67_08370 [Flavobacteriales bacterium]|nr:hypothetical protein [Flavobacteriales bacterium]